MSQEREHSHSLFFSIYKINRKKLLASSKRSLTTLSTWAKIYSVCITVNLPDNCLAFNNLSSVIHVEINESNLLTPVWLQHR